MFCGNCGAQVPDGAAVCPNCGAQMAAKTQAPQMNQAFQNAGARANGAAGGSGNNLDTKKIGMIAAAVVAVLVLFFVIKGIFGGSGLKGTYTDGSSFMTFKGNKVTLTAMGYEMTMKYKIKDDEIFFDAKSLKLSDDCKKYLADELDMDKDEIEEEIEDLKDDMGSDDDDESGISFKYNKKKNIITMGGEEFYYAENFKAGPSGKFVSDDDDEISISFKNGKATFDDDGDKETLVYYCYEDDDDDKVYVVFYGYEFHDSEFYDDYNTSSFTFDDDDEVEIGGIIYEK